MSDDDPRYIVTTRLMFDSDQAARQCMALMDTHDFGQIAREIVLEEVL